MMRVLFLCTGNSCRSQMAEGFCRQMHGESIEAHSAGTDPKQLDSRAVAVMAEAGVDISDQRAKGLDEVDVEGLDLVITVCDHAQETCPVFTGRTPVLHRGFEDPPRLAAWAQNEDEALAHYRRVRDQIRRWIERLPEELREPGSRPRSGQNQE